MPVPPDSKFETVSVVMLKEQATQLRSVASLRSSRLRRVSLSDVTREVIEEGLRIVLQRSITASTANGQIDGVAA